MNNLVLTLLILSSSRSFGQVQSNAYEQRALDYFASELFQKDYPENRNIEFTLRTEEDYSRLRHIKLCFENDTELETNLRKLEAPVNTERKSLTWRNKNVKTKKLKTDSRNEKLQVLKEVILESRHYVLINVYKNNEGISHYFFEMAEDLSVLRWCKTDEIY